MSSFPGVFTADHFQDVETLTLEPHFADYMGEAMKPLGVYVNFFQPTLDARRDALLPRDDGQRHATRRRPESSPSRSTRRTAARWPERPFRSPSRPWGP